MNTHMPRTYPNSRRLLVLTEDMVQRFSRHQIDTVGTDMLQAVVALIRNAASPPSLITNLNQLAQAAWTRHSMRRGEITHIQFNMEFA